MSYPADRALEGDDCCPPRELGDKLERGDEFCLLDVRTPEELELARIDSCLHIPLNELPERIQELEPWRDKEVVILCHHGMRSEMAQQFLRQQGFRRVRNLRGGIDAYSSEVDERIARY